VRATLDPRQFWFAGEIVAGRAVRASDLQERWDVSGAMARRDLRALHEKLVVEYVGPPKTGKWRLIVG